MEDRERLICGEGFKPNVKFYSLLAFEWAKFFVRLASFFVAPCVIIRFDPGTIPYVVALLAILSSVVIYLVPEVFLLCKDPHPGASVGATFVSVAFVGVVFMFSSDETIRAGGALLWAMYHVIDPVEPPRVVRIQQE